jgi:cytochrome b6-f complex iron-sulfur subunit
MSDFREDGAGGCGHACGADGVAIGGAVPENMTGIARRTFLVQSALMAAAAALAACGGDSFVTDPTIPTTTSGGGASNVLTLSSYPTLAAVGGVAMVTIGSARLAIVRTGDASFVALSRVCPHQGGLVQQSGSGFLCPNHGARFSLTGTWTGGQRTSNLHAYTTSYDATAGTLTIS